MLTITEKQRKFAVKHNTLMPYNSAHRVSVHQEPSSGTFITRVEKTSANKQRAISS
jgi:hypothetical protein